jgi:hypothetical protein
VRPLLAALGAVIASALWFVAPAAQAAEVQVLSYALLSDDKPVGQRDAGIRYLPRPRGEVRLLESRTTFDLAIPGASLAFEQRLGARFGGDRGFTSSTRVNGTVREIQAHLGVDGAWTVTVTSGGEARTWILAGDAVDLTSAELLDAERALPLLAHSATLRLLSAETGQVMTGPVTALEPSTLDVDGQAVPVQRFRWAPPEGPMVLAFAEDGVLLAYDWQAAGRLVGARMGRLPAPRTWGGGPEQPVVQKAVQEEGL